MASVLRIARRLPCDNTDVSFKDSKELPCDNIDVSFKDRQEPALWQYWRQF